MAAARLLFFMNLKERFIKKVEKTKGCWIWKSATINGGYGRFTMGKKQYLAHRVSYEIFKGAIPKGKGYHGTCVLHKCDNRLCVNPKHLFLGTQSENIKDAIIKHRHFTPDWSGMKNPNYGGVISARH